MKRTILIPSLLLAGCGMPSFPKINLFMVDVHNKVCAEYEIIDQKNLKFKLIAEHGLERCQNVAGFDDQGFPKAKNWIRDIQKKECK